MGTILELVFDILSDVVNFFGRFLEEINLSSKPMKVCKPVSTCSNTNFQTGFVVFYKYHGWIRKFKGGLEGSRMDGKFCESVDLISSSPCFHQTHTTRSYKPSDKNDPMSRF